MYSSGNRDVGGRGGNAYGDPKLSELHLGSGGGSGFAYSGGGMAAIGGRGGGALHILAPQIRITSTGSILCDGEPGATSYTTYGAGAGGGSGGSIFLQATKLINEGKISAMGGKKGLKGTTSVYTGICGDGGDGGEGRIRLDYRSLTGDGTCQPSPGYVKKIK